jgi:2-oxoglutarate ferredoxin oxidoreductase subunit beta
MIYIIENNGCYGLTKGQFSATADRGSVQKGGDVNQMEPIDCCALAIEMGCGYVARSFSGDAQQARALLMGALAHNGTAVLDIVSPCITFNNHEGSTNSYKYAKDHEEPLHDLGFIPFFEEIQVDFPEGETKLVQLHDGSRITLRKLGHDYDPGDRERALALCHQDSGSPHFYTGLLYYSADQPSMPDQLEMINDPLATLPADRVRPTAAALATIMERYT